MTLVAIVVALIVATGIGFAEGNFGKLQTVWSIASVYVGYLFATYMKNGRNGDDGS